MFHFRAESGSQDRISGASAVSSESKQEAPLPTANHLNSSCCVHSAGEHRRMPEPWGQKDCQQLSTLALFLQSLLDGGEALRGTD